MAKLNTLIIILSCQATADRRDACRETWLRRREEKPALMDGLEAVFVIGRPGQPSALCGDTLFLDCSDSYLGLPEKTWAACRESLILWDYDWLCKVDDDSLCLPLRVLHYPKTRDYIGRGVNDGKRSALANYRAMNWHRLVVPKKELTGEFSQDEADRLSKDGAYTANWAGGGWGYWLSRKAVRMVSEEPLSHVKRAAYEDRFVGGVMASHGIYLHGRHLTLRAYDYGESIFGSTIIHPLLPHQMRNVYYELHRAGEFGT